MIRLTDREWKPFFLNDIFDISATKSGIDKKKLVQGEGLSPYITRTDRNNGIDSFICEQPKNIVDEGNVITIGLDTQTIFYQPSSFYTGQNIQVLRNKHLNRYNAIFVISPIRMLLKKFNWGGNGATLTRLKRSKLLLPVKDDGRPDWEFMEEYMKNEELSILAPALDTLRKRLINNKLQTGGGNLEKLHN